MKILFLSTEPPYPPFNGVRIKTFHLVKGLSERGHEIHLISYNHIYDTLDLNIASVLQKYCASVQTFQLCEDPRCLVTNTLHSVHSKDIINFRFKSKRFMAAINTAVKGASFDLVHFDLVSLTHYVKSIDKLVPSVASVNDSYSLWLKNKLLRLPAPKLNSLFEKAYYSATFPLATSYEKSIFESFQKIHVVSNVDAVYLRSLNPALDVEVIPNGVDTEYFKPLGLTMDEPSLVFVASMHGENASNALWFIRKVLVKVRKRISGIKLYLVGKDPDSALLSEAMRNKNVIVTGYVNDVRPFIDSATVVVDPTMKCCGIFNHVLQSMAMGKVVVGTRSSFSAIKGAVSWKNGVVAKNETDFASSIVRLVKNESERKTIGANARRLIEQGYQWSAMIPRYEKMYAAAIEKLGGSVPCGVTQ